MGDDEAAAFAEFSLHRDLAAQSLANLLDDVEPEPSRTLASGGFDDNVLNFWKSSVTSSGGRPGPSSRTLDSRLPSSRTAVESQIREPVVSI
jgi:hypothetical protein